MKKEKRECLISSQKRGGVIFFEAHDGNGNMIESKMQLYDLITRIDRRGYSYKFSPELEAALKMRVE